MSGLKTTPMIGECPFCGMSARLPHETQAACIAALHAEIGRTKDILAALKPAGTRERTGHREEPGAVQADRDLL